MSGHTPGPWKVHQRPNPPIDLGHHVTTEGGLQVCKVTYQLPAGVNGSVVEVARIANARLIAAAPDLLESLSKLVAIEDSTGMAVIGWTEAMEAARAAIARATGTQP